MSEMAGGYPHPPQTNGPPYQPAHGGPTYQSGSVYPASPPPYAAPQYGNAVQPFDRSVPALAYPRANAQPLVSAGGRLGALLLEGLLIMVTFGIGWLIWSVITWSDGQTPAKKLLGHVVADAHSGAAFDWGRMALREFCVKGLLGSVLNLVTFGIYFWIDAFMCLGDRQRTLHDRMANSVVRFR